MTPNVNWKTYGNVLKDSKNWGQWYFVHKNLKWMENIFFRDIGKDQFYNTDFDTDFGAESLNGINKYLKFPATLYFTVSFLHIT